MRTHLLMIMLSALLSSCYSYKVFPEVYRNYTYSGEKKKAYVLNPKLSKEYIIFKSAALFTITNDSLDNAAVKIKLYPLGKHIMCGEPALASLLTLGQLPVLLPDTYTYRFDEIVNIDTTQRTYDLQIAMRYWFWDVFTFRKGFD